MANDIQGERDRATAAAVAYDLMRDILFEDPARPAPDSPDFRPYVLDLYAECLLAVRGMRAPAEREEARAIRPRRAANAA